MEAIDKKGYAFNADQGALITSLLKAELYRCLSAAGLAIGTDKKKVKITNTTVYLHNGIFKSKSTADTVALTATTHNVVGTVTEDAEAVFVICLSSNGTTSFVKGATVTSATLGAGMAKFPEYSAITETPIGYVRIMGKKNTTGFVANTTELDSTDLTVSYGDMGYFHPQVATVL